MRQRDRLALTLIILFGAAFRFALLTEYRFHADEALFAALGRLIITGRDPLLAQTQLLVDKPPLFYYSLAGGISFCWGCEFTPRLPGLWASIITIPLTARLSWTLWRSSSAMLITALFVAVSPFAILFSPIVFADPQMTMWLCAALLMVASGRWGWGGFLFGLGLAVKQNALFFLPILPAIGLIANLVDKTTIKNVFRWFLRFMIGLLPVILLMILWESLRGDAVGFWSAGVTANNPGRLIRSDELISRLMAWFIWLDAFTGVRLISVGLGVLLLGLPLSEFVSHRRSREAALSLTLWAYTIATLAFLWLVAFPIFDRYLLILVPIAGLLIGRAAIVFRGRAAFWLRSGILATLLLIPIASLRSPIPPPVGGDHGALDGIDQTADFLDALPDGTVIYNQSLNWHLNYYLFDYYVFPVTFVSPADLTSDLQHFGGEQSDRYLLLSQHDPPDEILRAVGEGGFRAEVVFSTTNRFGDVSFTIYYLTLDL